MKKYSTIILVSMFLSVSLSSEIFSQTDAPILGDPYSESLPLKKEDAIGLALYRNLQSYNYIDNNPLISSYINYLGNKLSRNLLDQDRQYNFFVVKSNQINAFAVPGGYIGLNSGLIKLTKNEAQLAGVVSHEIAHIKLRHSAEMIASSRSNSIPMWVGIISGLFAGNAQASMAAIKAGIGLSSQMNINLVRSNEIDADNYAIEIMQRSNYDILEMSNFFDSMENSTGEIQREISYLYTHPMYENRIANIQNKAGNQKSSQKNSTNDYFFVKNIIEVNNIKDINREISSLRGNDLLTLHRLALLYFKKSDYKNAIKHLKNIKDNKKANLYTSILHAKVLSSDNKIDEAIAILNNLKKIYPLNKTVSFTLLEILIENNIKPDYTENLIQSLGNQYMLNPDYLRLVSKFYTHKNNKYLSSIYLSDFYALMSDPNMAIEVLNNSMQSSKINTIQREILSKKKLDIICSNPRPLEPIFGEKTCN